MKTRMVWLASLVAIAAVSAAPLGALAQKKQRDVITREEILKSAQRDVDLYAAIQVLRPHFLKAPRGTRSLGGSYTSPLAVYIDKIRQPELDVLLQVKANTIAEVRYLDPSRSQNEYGITANGGAIVVKLFKGQLAADSLTRPPE